MYFLVTRVTLPGLVGVLMGAPFAPSRISVARGAVDAPGLGISLRYDVGEETDPGRAREARARDLRKGSAEGVPDSPRAGGLAPRGAGRAVARRPSRRLRARARRAGRGRRLCRRGPARAREQTGTNCVFPQDVGRSRCPEPSRGCAPHRAARDRRRCQLTALTAKAALVDPAALEDGDNVIATQRPSLGNRGGAGSRHNLGVLPRRRPRA